MRSEIDGELQGKFGEWDSGHTRVMCSTKFALPAEPAQVHNESPYRKSGISQIEFDTPADRVVGIDLGTTNSLIAWMNLGRPEVIEGEDGGRIVPSVVSLLPGWLEVIVGEAARASPSSTIPTEAFIPVKTQLMGRGVADVQDELKLFPFRIAEGSEAGDSR